MRLGSWLLLCTIGCASSQTTTVAERVTVTSGFDGERVDLTHQRDIHTMDYAAPAENVFRAVLAAHEELKIPLQTADSRVGRATFMLQTNRMRIADRRASEYLDCGNGPTGPRADSYRITLRVTAVIDNPQEDSARLRTLITASAREAGQSSQELSCTTTGELERRIAATVARLLRY